ncbi:hypothetical protein [Streptomyces exfoliatus]|uniref:hypothetical protein n=1 Tax=Streptomyces exfoliatus TaxID=1905 RepID=UPI0004C4F530|nr:hypothetical protein [Streptomyces exfoliatus]
MPDVLDGRAFNLATIVIATLALILGIVGVIYARRALFPPKREITYAIESAPLMNETSTLQHGVSVVHNGVTIRDPHMFTLRLTNTGRHAVASDYFDQARPLAFDLGTPILETTTTFGGRYSTQGSVISFGPDLLASKQSISFTALTEGRPDVQVQEYLIDTKLRKLVDQNLTPRTVVIHAPSLFAAVAASVSAVLSLLSLG